MSIRVVKEGACDTGNVIVGFLLVGFEAGRSNCRDSAGRHFEMMDRVILIRDSRKMYLKELGEIGCWMMFVI